MRAPALFLLCVVPIAVALTRAPSEVAGYKSWKLITPKPLDMDPLLVALCAPPTPGMATAHTDGGKRFFRVYVNDKGEKAMKNGGAFPSGSTIVKEKLIGPGTDYKVELLTVMNKRGKSWDFFVAKLDGTRITPPKEIENCVGCHRNAASQDMVFRTYTHAH